MAMAKKNAGMQIVQFSHACINCFTTLDGLKNDLQELCLFDRAGIHSFSVAFQWISRFLAIMPKGYEAINEHMTASPTSGGCVSHLQCLQAFTELVLRTAHYRIFGTGKRHVVDCCNLLLRTGGCALANKLLALLSCSGDEEDLDLEKQKNVALQTMANVMSAWMGIMIVTTVGNDRTPVVQSSEHDFVRDAAHFDDSTSFGKVAHCILEYARTYLMANKKDNGLSMQKHAEVKEDNNISGRDSPIARASSSSSSSSSSGYEHHSAIIEDDEDDDIPLPIVPQMYLRSVLNQGVSSSGDDNMLLPPLFSDPSVPRRPDGDMCHAWDFCWRHLAQGSNEGMRLALFRPLLLHVAVIAKNMIKANALYMIEHIVTAPCPSSLKK